MKTDATVTALGVALLMIDSETIVVLFQNGFTAHEMVPDRLKAGTIIGSATRYSTQIAGSGEAVDDATGKTVVGNDDDAIERLAKILSAAGFEAVADNGPTSGRKQFVSIHSKLTVTLTGLANGDRLKFDSLKTALKELVAEADCVHKPWESKRSRPIQWRQSTNFVGKIRKYFDSARRHQK